MSDASTSTVMAATSANAMQATGRTPLQTVGMTYQGLKEFKRICRDAVPSLLPELKQNASKSQTIIINGVEATAWHYKMRCSLGNATSTFTFGRPNRCTFFIQAQGIGPDRHQAVYTIISQCINHSEHDPEGGTLLRKKATAAMHKASAAKRKSLLSTSKDPAPSSPKAVVKADKVPLDPALFEGSEATVRPEVLASTNNSGSSSPIPALGVTYSTMTLLLDALYQDQLLLTSQADPWQLSLLSEEGSTICDCRCPHQNRESSERCLYRIRAEWTVDGWRIVAIEGTHEHATDQPTGNEDLPSSPAECVPWSASPLNDSRPSSSAELASPSVSIYSHQPAAESKGVNLSKLALSVQALEQQVQSLPTSAQVEQLVNNALDARSRDTFRESSPLMNSLACEAPKSREGPNSLDMPASKRRRTEDGLARTEDVFPASGDTFASKQDLLEACESAMTAASWWKLAITEAPDWIEVRCTIKLGICEHSKHCPFLIIAEDDGSEWKVLFAEHKHDGHRLGSEESALPGMPMEAVQAAPMSTEGSEQPETPTPFQSKQLSYFI